MRPEWHGASCDGFKQEVRVLLRVLIYTRDYTSECARRDFGAADICLSSSKLTVLECTPAPILSSAADFITVGYGAYDLGNDTHTTDSLSVPERDAPRGFHDGPRIYRPDAPPPLFGSAVTLCQRSSRVRARPGYRPSPRGLCSLSSSNCARRVRLQQREHSFQVLGTRCVVFHNDSDIFMLKSCSFPAEKALATVNGKPIPGVHPPTALNLEAFPPHLSPRSRPNPTARPRVVSNLPPNFTDSRLFDIFRGYGPISSARLQPNLGPDIAVIEFWREDDARRAEETMHCSEVDDCSITVHVYQPPRKNEFSVNAPPFIPSGMYPRLGPGSPPPPQSPLLVGENKSDSRSPYSHSPSTLLRHHERTCHIRAHRRCMAHRYLRTTTARSCMVPANRSNSHPYLVQARLVPAASSTRATYSAKTSISI